VRRALLSLVLVLVLAGVACAESSVWKAQKGATTLYLGGTFHILREADFPLPTEFDRAYRASQLLVFETDLGRFQDPAVQKRVLAKGSYPDGSSIEKHLSPQAYRELARYCEKSGFPLAAFSQLKPSLLMTTLTLLELSRLGVSRQGVDQHYYRLALKDKKRVRGLESLEAHLDYLVGMGEGDEDAFVSHSLKEMASLEEKFQALAAAWRRGDSAFLGNFLVADVQRDEPRLYEKLLVERNRSWLRQIEGFGAGETAFVLVGAAHLVGPDGLIEGLRKKGYRVTKL